jgi:hypothetical protein
MRRFRFLRDPAAGIWPVRMTLISCAASAVRTCLLFTGGDESRTRALVTLLHGNEPSGVRALRRWLLSQQQPAVNLLCIVASVHAALELPEFSHRMLPARPGSQPLFPCSLQ